MTNPSTTVGNNGVQPERTSPGRDPAIVSEETKLAWLEEWTRLRGRGTAPMEGGDYDSLHAFLRAKYAIAYKTESTG
jgi:hypothetical protein